MRFFEYEDFLSLVKDRIAEMPKKGRGELQRLSKHIGIHTTRMSHIMKEKESPTLEQASLMAEYFGFSDLEKEYFVTLVARGRAGNQSLRELYTRQLQDLRKRSKELAKRLPTDRRFTEAEQGIFYSNWFYSAIRLLSQIEGYQDLDSISDRLSLPKQTVRTAMDFLLETGLCVEDEGFRMGAKKTHLPANSLMISRLHSNWRLKAIEGYPILKPEDLALSAPMSIHSMSYPAIREVLASAIEKIIKIAAEEEDPDMLACLNIDLFRF